MAADMQGAVKREFFETYSHPAAAGVLAARAGSLRPADRAAGVRWLVAILPSHRLGRTRWAASRPPLKSIAPDESFWYVSGRSSNEAGFLLQLFARLYGTNNVNNCSYYCHQASGVGLDQRPSAWARPP